MCFDAARPGLRRRTTSLALLAALASACATERGARALRVEQEGAAAVPQADPDADYVSEFRSAQGLILGVRAQRSWLGGDFDGDTTLTGPDTISVPDADQGDGYVLSIGAMKDGDAYLFSYTRERFDGDVLGRGADVQYRAFAFEVQHYLRANEPVQPYLSLGLVLPYMTLEDASSAGLAPGDAHLRMGFGLSVGGGVAWWIDRHLAFDVRTQYTYQTFREAEGVLDDSQDIDDELDASMLSVSVGLTWTRGGT